MVKVFQLVGLSHTDDEIRVGNEWYPYGQQFMLEVSWLALALVPLGFVPLLLDARPSRLRRVDGKVVALGIIAVTFLVLYLIAALDRGRAGLRHPVLRVRLSRALPERVTEPLRAHLTPDGSSPSPPWSRSPCSRARRLGRSRAGRRPHRP